MFLILSLSIISCGGGGDPESDPDPQVEVDPNANPEVETPTLTLGAPSPDTVVTPPSNVMTQVTFLSVVSGAIYPETLSLDELDSTGNVLNFDIAQLRDNC
ncbi:MAG: hypothetical protein ACJAUP_001959 [Cellvibrionaceae bacterium]